MRAADFINQAKGLGLVLPKLEITRLCGLTFVSAFDERPTAVMANDSSAGVAPSPDLATLKALVEHFERRVFSDGARDHLLICSRLHSDGIAAYPASDPDAQLKARANAYNEAFERFVWARWWDDRNIGHHLLEGAEIAALLDTDNQRAFTEFSKRYDAEKLYLVQPKVQSKKSSLFIFFAKLRGLGFVSGGAAGEVGTNQIIFLRALAELIRHAEGVTRFEQSGRTPESFYEKRLMFFGSGRGNELAASRLRTNGESWTALPDLEWDAVIPHQATEKLIVVHRCLFHNQPPFVDGALERLCL